MHASYCATRLNAATDSAKRVRADSVPPLPCSSSITAAYCEGSVATATRAKFFAAERSIAGPPMSMFSTISSIVLPGFTDTFSNGYRFSTSRSIGAMPCCAITASSVPLRPSRPPCTSGCSVLTRPSIISGNCVSSLTSRTARPASRSAFAVPPVETSSTPCAASARARSVRPVLSETDNRARRTGRRSAVMLRRHQRCGAGNYTGRNAIPGRAGRRRASAHAVIAELLAQRCTVDAEHGRGAALVAFAIGQHFGEQRNLEFTQRDVVQVLRFAPVHVAQVTTHRIGDVIPQWWTRTGTAVWAIGGGVQTASPGTVRTRPRPNGTASLARPLGRCHAETHRSAEIETESDDPGRGLDDIQVDGRRLAGGEGVLRRCGAQVFARRKRARADHAALDVRQAHHQARPGLRPPCVVAEARIDAQGARRRGVRADIAAQHREGFRLAPVGHGAAEEIAQRADGRAPTRIGGECVALCEQQLQREQQRETADRRDVPPTCRHRQPCAGARAREAGRGRGATRTCALCGRCGDGWRGDRRWRRGRLFRWNVLLWNVLQWDALQWDALRRNALR